MDTNTGGSPGYLSQSQWPGNSPSEEVIGKWTPTGCGPRVIQYRASRDCGKLQIGDVTREVKFLYNDYTNPNTNLRPSRRLP